MTHCGSSTLLSSRGDRVGVRSFIHTAMLIGGKVFHRSVFLTGHAIVPHPTLLIANNLTVLINRTVAYPTLRSVELAVVPVGIECRVVDLSVGGVYTAGIGVVSVELVRRNDDRILRLRRIDLRSGNDRSGIRRLHARRGIGRNHGGLRIRRNHGGLRIGRHHGRLRVGRAHGGRRISLSNTRLRERLNRSGSGRTVVLNHPALRRNDPRSRTTRHNLLTIGHGCCRE